MKVRQAAWHTLEEDHGGRCDAPKLYSILVEIVETEVSPKLRQEANDIVKKARIKAQTIEKKKQISRVNATITLLENVIGGAIQRPMSLIYMTAKSKLVAFGAQLRLAMNAGPILASESVCLHTTQLLGITCSG